MYYFAGTAKRRLTAAGDMLYYHLVFHCACVAQLAEQLTRNEQVADAI